MADYIEKLVAAGLTASAAAAIIAAGQRLGEALQEHLTQIDLTQVDPDTLLQMIEQLGG